MQSPAAAHLGCGGSHLGDCSSLPCMHAHHGRDNLVRLPLPPGCSELLESPLAQALLPPSLYLPYSLQYTHQTLTQQLDQGAAAARVAPLPAAMPLAGWQRNGADACRRTVHT